MTTASSSSAYLSQYGGKAPADHAENTAFHQDLIDALQAEAERNGWVGSDIHGYQRREGYVSLSIVPGETPLDIEKLRIFRERQRAEALPAASSPQRERLI